MTNFEKYKEQLLSFNYVKGHTPAKKNGKLVRCINTHCIECDFVDGNCTTNFIKWLYENCDKAECCENCAYFDTSTVGGSMCEVCDRNYSNQFKPKPKKTRQDEFLEHYPNAKRCYGVVDICPKDVDKHFSCKPLSGGCTTCCQNYWWSQEVEK